MHEEVDMAEEKKHTTAAANTAEEKKDAATATDKAEEKTDTKTAAETTTAAAKPATKKPKSSPASRLGIVQKRGKKPSAPVMETLTIHGRSSDVKHLLAVIEHYHKHKPTPTKEEAEADVLADMVKHAFGRWMKPTDPTKPKRVRNPKETK